MLDLWVVTCWSLPEQTPLASAVAAARTAKLHIVALPQLAITLFSRYDFNLARQKIEGFSGFVQKVTNFTLCTTCIKFAKNGQNRPFLFVLGQNYITTRIKSVNLAYFCQLVQNLCLVYKNNFYGTPNGILLFFGYVFYLFK